MAAQVKRVFVKTGLRSVFGFFCVFHWVGLCSRCEFVITCIEICRWFYISFGYNGCSGSQATAAIV